MLRNRSITIAIFIAVLFGAVCFAGDPYVPGELIVKFKDNEVLIDVNGSKVSADKAVFGSGKLVQLNKKHGLLSVKRVSPNTKKIKKLRNGKQVELPDLSNFMLMEFPKNIDMNAVLNDYKDDPSVENVSLNYIRQLYTTPDDIFYLESPSINGNQWGLFKIWLKPTGSNSSGWDLYAGTNEVKVAVIDSGANFDHVDLKGRLNTLEGWDFANNDPYAIDDHGHGTHVSGIIGAETNNLTGVAGVDWHCRIIPIKAFTPSGGSDTDIASSIDWAVSKEADIINMSFGPSDPSSSGYSFIVASAIARAVTADCVLVAAVGNDNISSPVKYPAAYAGVIAVAATDSNDYKASYSNYGTWVDVSAPGGDNGPGSTYFTYYILSTYIPSGYTYAAGTSMSSPFVTGLAALIRGKEPTLDAESVAQRIMFYTDNIDNKNPGYAGKLGSGRINAFAALGGLYGRFIEPPNYPPKGEESVPTIIGVADIRGTATGLGFDHYVLEYGTGTSPTTWATVGAISYTPIVNDTLGVFDATGMDGWVTFRLTLNSSIETEKRMTVRAGSITSPILEHNAQYGPNPFNPNKGGLLIKYKMDANSDVYIYFYDIASNLIAKKYFAYGSNGGSSGDNAVYWDGKNDFGETVANGVYLFRIASEGRTIGKGKIAVVK